MNNPERKSTGETAEGDVGRPCASCYAYAYCEECLAFLNSEGYIPNWYYEKGG